MKKLFNILFILLITAHCITCNDSNDSVKIKKDLVSGVVQKGPFINGTTISVAELDNEFGPTGRTFNAQIMDNSGLFEVKNIELASHFAELKADGFYFNEVKGEKSLSQLTLYALSDLSDRDTVNVNILSHLERVRMQFLIGEGNSFSEAKTQAAKEVLAIFKIDSNNTTDFTNLNITKSGDENAILLAISVILQGYRSTGELSELLANIVTDIRKDGVLNSSSIKLALINDIVRIDLSSVRKNIETRYEQLGMSISIPDFEKFVKNFIDNSDVASNLKIEYPETGNYGKNILNPDFTKGKCGENISLKAVVPEGMKLSVKIQAKCEMKEGSIPAGIANNPTEETGWKIDSSDEVSRTFSTAEYGELDLGLQIMCSKILVEYFENGETEPVESKILNATGYCDDGYMDENPDDPFFDLHDSGKHGPNLLKIITEASEDTINLDPGVFSISTYFRNTEISFTISSSSSDALSEISDIEGWEVEDISNEEFPRGFKVKSTETILQDTEYGRLYYLDAGIEFFPTDPAQKIYFQFKESDNIPFKTKTIIINIPETNDEVNVINLPTIIDWD